jgi:PBSX family phage terminase large subunit
MMNIFDTIRRIDFRKVPDVPGALPEIDETEDLTLQKRAIPPGMSQYRPYGYLEQVFYDRSDLVGVVGPAGTGKSRNLLEKIHLIAEKYPSCRILLCRKTRASMTQTMLWTYETEVLPPGHEALDGGKRSHRQQYDYNNKAEIVICGLDDTQKIMSAQYDIIYIQEAIECTYDDIEMLSTRLRNGVVPYQQILFCCNPSYPLHWINQRALANQFKLYPSYHEDNPRLWEEAPKTKIDPMQWPDKSPDGRIGRWTKKGLDYISKLDKLTGARYKRLRLGKWAAAEGAVYEGWNAEVHLVPYRKLPSSWARVWIVDFGFTAPFCWQCWAIDGDQGFWLEHEIYMTNRLVSTHAQDILITTGWRVLSDGRLIKSREDATPLPHAAICDWDAEGRATLEQEMPGIRWESAYKTIADGIQAVANKLVVREGEDGRLTSSIHFMRDVLVEVDSLLQDDAKPTSTVQEFDSYVWDTRKVKAQGAGEQFKEEPLDENNHGMDCLRYLCAWMAKLKDKYKAKEVAMAATPVQYVKGVKQNRQTSRSQDRQDNNNSEWRTLQSTKRRTGDTRLQRTSTRHRLR